MSHVHWRDHILYPSRFGSLFFFQKQTSLYNLAFEVDRASLPVVAGNEQLYTKSPFSLDFGDD